MKKYPFKFVDSVMPIDHTYSKELEKTIIRYNHREMEKYYHVLKKYIKRLDLNMDNEDNNIREAYMICKRYGLPVKKWIPTEAFLKDTYGVYLLGRMLSFDQNIIYDLRKDKDNNDTDIDISSELEENYKKLLHKIHLVGVPLEYVDTQKWYRLNRMFRWYEKSLATELLNRYNINVQGRKVSRGWLKLYEILKIFKFNVDDSKHTIKTFHICEAPGNMMMCMNYYITNDLKLSHKWNAQSLVESNIYDDYGLIKKHKEKWDFGKKGTGDIMDPENIQYYRDMYGNSGIDWVTSDCGARYVEQEMTIGLHFASLLTVMSVLKDGGDFVFKLYFPIKSDILIDLLYTVSKRFKKLYFYKSYQNTWNTEVYMIGKGYKYDKNIIDYLFKVYDNKMKGLDSAPVSFKLKLYNFTRKLYKIFSKSIDRNYYYYDHFDDLDRDTLKPLIKERNKDWIKMFIKNEDLSDIFFV